MDIVITLAVGVIALCMAFGKPLQITVTHKYDNPPLPPPELSPEEKVQMQNDDNKEAIKSMDAVVKTLNEMMGVSVIGHNDK